MQRINVILTIQVLIPLNNSLKLIFLNILYFCICLLGPSCNRGVINIKISAESEISKFYFQVYSVTSKWIKFTLSVWRVNGIKFSTPLNVYLKCSHKMKNGYKNFSTFFYYFKTILTFMIMYYVTFNKENIRQLNQCDWFAKFGVKVTIDFIL